MSEDQLVVIPHSEGPLRGQIRRAVSANSGHVPKALFAHDALHVSVKHASILPLG